MSLAALTQSGIAEMVEAAALLSPISYLGHISSQFVLRMVGIHLDQVFSFFMRVFTSCKFLITKIMTIVYSDRWFWLWVSINWTLEGLTIPTPPFSPCFFSIVNLQWVVVWSRVLLVCSEWGVNLLDSICDRHIECNDLLTSITGLPSCPFYANLHSFKWKAFTWPIMRQASGKFPISIRRLIMRVP